MKFSSIQEYFYRLQSRCYALLLLPLVLLIALYILQRFTTLTLVSIDKETVFIVNIAVPVLVLLELTSVHLVAYVKLKSIRQLKGMGDRLDSYASLITIKMIIGVSSSVIVLAALLVTQDELFLVYLVVCLVFILIQRPTPKMLSNQLRLKGDERELIVKGQLV